MAFAQGGKHHFSWFFFKKGNELISYRQNYRFFHDYEKFSPRNLWIDLKTMLSSSSPHCAPCVFRRFIVFFIFCSVFFTSKNSVLSYFISIFALKLQNLSHTLVYHSHEPITSNTPKQ
jgi:hypothetical protein